MKTKIQRRGLPRFFGVLSAETQYFKLNKTAPPEEVDILVCHCPFSGPVYKLCRDMKTCKRERVKKYMISRFNRMGIVNPTRFFIMDRSTEGSAWELILFAEIKKVLIEHFNISEHKILFLTTNKNNVSGCIKYFHWSWPQYKDFKLEVKHVPNKPYKFLFLGGTPRLPKLMLLLYLHHLGLLKHSKWSFFKISNLVSPERKSWMFRANSELQTLMDVYYDDITKITPKILDVDPTDKTRTDRAINHTFYEQTYFSLISETEFTDKDNYINRYTEKTYKCFVAKHPFVVAGNPLVLENLREDGFKTFHPYIDESYDKIYDIKDRITAIMNEVTRLCNLSNDEWDVLLADLEPILRHNEDIARRAPMIKVNIDRILNCEI